MAQQPGQVAYSIIDAKAVGRFMPPVFPGAKADSLAELARQLGLDASAFRQTLNDYKGSPRWRRNVDRYGFLAYSRRPVCAGSYESRSNPRGSLKH